MVDYESNTIKPVQGLDTVTGLAPSRPREERKRRQHLQQGREQSAQSNGPLPEKQPQSKDNPNTDGIDYCA